MRTASVFAAASLAAAMGIFVPGCMSGPRTEPFGSICAAPLKGHEFCVPAQEGPASAWKQAEAGGSLPIQMWVERPSGMSLSDLVASESDLNRWFATVDEILTYVREEKGNAESYKATLQGKLRSSLKQAKDRQKKLLAETPVDAVGNFKAALAEKASSEKDPLVATLANDKQSMDAVQNVFEKAKADAQPLVSAYASLVSDFIAYRATETAESHQYKSLAADASKAALGGLTEIEQAIATAAQSASAQPSDLMAAIMKLSAQIQQFELASQEAIEPHADFMMTHGAAQPDMTSRAMRSLNAMLGYIEARVARSDATATALLSGVGMRRKALQMLAASPGAKSEAAEAKLSEAAAVFEGASMARVSALKSAPLKSAKLGLPYLAKRYDELLTVLQMQPLCDSAAPSWRDAGCAPLKDTFKDASAYFKETLPALLSAGIAAMKASGGDAALLDLAKAKLDAGDIKAAAVLHDAALRGMEEGQ